MDHRRHGHSSNRRRSRSRSGSKSQSSPMAKRDRKSDNGRSRSPSSLSHFVCIENLPSDTNLAMLQLTINDYVGSYVFVQILQRPGSSSMKALVEFENEDILRKCIRKMDQLRFGGKVLDVSEVQDIEGFLQKHDTGFVSSRSKAVESRANNGRQSNPDPTGTFNASYSYDMVPEGQSSIKHLRSYDETTARHASPNEGGSSRPQWLFSGDDQEGRRQIKERSPDTAEKMETLQNKLWSSVWKTRLGKKVEPSTSVQVSPAQVSTASTSAMGDTTVSGGQTSSANDPVAQAALEIMTGAFHIRRALEIMRKSDAAQDSFRASALFLRQFTEELSDWKDMYFSRDSDGSRSGTRPMQTISQIFSLGEEKEKIKNQVEVNGEWCLEEGIFTAPMPPSVQNSAVKLSYANIGTIQAPLATSWFMIGPAQPRFSSTAAIRRAALDPLIEIQQDKAKLVLTHFAYLAPASTLSRCIRAISLGGYVDLDLFSRPDPTFRPSSNGQTVPGDCGSSFSNWFRWFEFVIKVAEMIGAPNEYLTSLTAYKRVIEMWWRVVASADMHAASLLWLPFYELFDKAWRMYASRSPEYRSKLHIFDAWWVYHHLDPMTAKLRVPLPPYDAQSCAVYLRQVSDHFEDMIRKSTSSDAVSPYSCHQIDTGLEVCSVCGDCDHKMMENGRAVQLLCPFTSRRFPWCPDMYDGVCEKDQCIRQGKHVCAHCANPGHLMKTCPNCKCLIV